ncbi:MAG: hypothetical protein ACFFD4_05110 [Candidatus Odinarchaeota archaeon]
MVSSLISMQFINHFVLLTSTSEGNDTGILTAFLAGITDLPGIISDIFTFFLSARFGSCLILLAAIRYVLNGKNGRMLSLVGFVLLLFG